MSEAGLDTAAAAVRHSAWAAIEPNTGSDPAHLRNMRRSGINRLQSLYYILAAMLVAGARRVARAIQIDADPSLVADLLENPMAGRKIDVPVAQVVNAFEELRLGRVLLVALPV